MEQQLPPSVTELLRGWPIIGQWEQMLPLFTVDQDGGVRVCLLSRAEMDTDGEYVTAAIASRTTAANLRLDGRATLMVVASDAAIYCRLRSIRQLDVPGEPLGVCFEVTDIKNDGVGVPLRGSEYFVDAALENNESWALSRKILAELT